MACMCLGQQTLHGISQLKSSSGKMSQFSQLYSSIHLVLQNNSTAIRNVTVTLIVFVIELIIDSEELFQCPPQYFALYGYGFIVIPAVFLSLVTLLVDNDFWNFIRGCCFFGRRVGLKKLKFCCCGFPRWGCKKSLRIILLQSSFSGFLWIILSLLRGEYYVCAVLGGTKAEKLLNAANETETAQIEADYSNARRNSQLIALAFLGISVILTFVSLAIYRCCCQNEVGSLPTPDEYEKLESAAAVRAFKANMEKLAEEQGKRRADLYFATKNKTSPFEILKKAYEDLTKENEFDLSFQPLNEYEIIRADAASAAFKAKVQQDGAQKVDLAVNTTWSKLDSECEEKGNAFELVKKVRDDMADRYPRSTGNKGKPYVKYETAGDGAQAQRELAQR